MRSIKCNLSFLVGAALATGCTSQPKPEDSGVDLGVPTTIQQLEKLGKFGNAILAHQEIMDKISSSVEITVLVPADAGLGQNQITTDMIKDHIALAVVDRAGRYTTLSGKTWNVEGNVNAFTVNGIKVTSCRNTITNLNIIQNRQSPVCSIEKPLAF